MDEARPALGYPKTARLLRSSDFRKVYEEGFRVPGPFFTAFCLRQPRQDPARIGFTAPRALGKAVVRNRLKRRVREAARRQLGQLRAGWAIVINPRRSALTADFAALEQEVRKLFSRCDT